MSDLERRILEEKRERHEKELQTARDAEKRSQDFDRRKEEERRKRRENYDTYVPRVKSMVDSAITVLGRQTWSDGFAKEFSSKRDDEYNSTLATWSIGRTHETKKILSRYVERWHATLAHDLTGKWDEKEEYYVSLIMENDEPCFEYGHLRTDDISSQQLDDLMLKMYQNGPKKEYRNYGGDMRGEGMSRGG